jgi:hypothetical protein
MEKRTLFFTIFIIFLSASCFNTNQKLALINEKSVDDTIFTLKEVQEKNHFIDSVTNHKHGISLITEKPTETEKEWSIQAGYNDEARFETYFQFYFNPETKQISVEDFISGNKESLDAWRNDGKDSIYLSLGQKLLESEHIGNLKIDMPESEISKQLGKADEISKPTKWETDGLNHQTLIYKQKGIELDICWDKPKDKKIFTITINSNCKLKTLCNIGIGSPRELVIEKYKTEIDTRSIELNTITAGSVFAGMVFTFENNNVSSIFIGATAE